MKWYLEVLRKYAVFSGRATRSEFWYFGLINMIVMLVLMFIDARMGTIQSLYGYGALSGLYWLAMIIPSIAVGVRRLHDTDRSAWWVIWALIPLLGTIVLTVVACLKGTPHKNRYDIDQEPNFGGDADFFFFRNEQK